MSFKQIKKRHMQVEDMIEVGHHSVQNAWMQAAHLDRALLIRVLDKVCSDPHREVDLVVKADHAAAINEPKRPRRPKWETIERSGDG